MCWAGMSQTLQTMAEIPETDTTTRVAIRPLRWGSRWQIGGVFLVLALITLSLLPPIATLVARGEDKLLHAMAYGTLMLYYSGLVRPRLYLVVVVGLMGLGIAIEALQGYVGYRAAEADDVIANGVGIATGLVLALLGLRGWARVIEARYAGTQGSGT
jgi:VanZ family protein